MAPKRSIFRSRKVRISLILLFLLAVAVIGSHIWFVNNARSLLVAMVHEKSKGKVRLELSEVSFDFFSRKLKVREADILSTDSATSATTYQVKFRKLTIRLNSISALIFEKKLYLDSVKLHDPDITVMQWREDTSGQTAGDELSLPQEMGKLYNSMLDVLDDVGIKRIIINNAKVSLVNKMKKGTPPVTISRIYFDLKRTAENARGRDAYVEGKQSIELRTTDQDILLPGGRHRLAFQKFKLEVFGRHMQLDSCTIRAIPTDSSKSSYTIFFEKLLLSGVDFGAMYRRNLIRADSVYCVNPQIYVNLNTRGSGEKKERPDPEKIIQELTGDLDLGFVGVKDAGIDIEIKGNKNLRITNSDKDDFELRGLRINSDSSRSVTVQRFDMKVSDFSLQNDDSTTSYTFDSVHFQNNGILLSNFTVATTLSYAKQHNYRDFRIPYFHLTGIDWYELVFEQNLKAKEAQMINPVIRYASAGGKKKKRKSSIFSSLETIGELVTLDKVNVVNGDINAKMGPQTTLSLQNANLSLFSNDLLRSRNNEGLRRAVDQLSFSRGELKLKSTTLTLNNVRSTPASLLIAGGVKVSSKNDAIRGSMNDVVITNMVLDDLDESIMVDGITWGSASLELNQRSNSEKDKKEGKIELSNISGRNTSLRFQNAKTNVSTFVSTVKVSSLIKSGTGEIYVNGLTVHGNDLTVKSSDMIIKADDYSLVGEGTSTLKKVTLNQVKGKDTIAVTTPVVVVNANLNDFLAGQKEISIVELQDPRIKVVKRNPPTSVEGEGGIFRINAIRLLQPNINIAVHKNDSVSLIHLPSSTNNTITISSLQLNGGETRIGGITLKANAGTFTKATGEVFGVTDGGIDLVANDLSFGKQNGVSSWKGLLTSLHVQNPNSFTFGKTNSTLLINQLSLGNVNLSSAYMKDMSRMIKYNVGAWLKTGTGTLTDSSTTLKWYNAEYNYGKRELSLDSFSYQPTQPRDSVVKNTPHQIDYITFKSGRLKFSDFNLDKYEKDSALIAQTIHISNPVMTIYRDKKPPFLGGVIKPLPVQMIKAMPMPVSVEKIVLSDGHLSYTEKNAKSRAEGTIALTHLNATISNFRNRDLTPTDSLSMVVNAYLLDSAELNLRIKESYTDSLAGFLMTLRMKPTTLSFLNPVLAPLSNVIFKSGTIDSLHLRAIGRDDISFGEMQMFYHDLKVRLVKEGQPDNRSLGTNIISYLANLLVIKKNNDGRTGLVYFERLRDRSFFNYIVKMAFSGMATSVGAKKNKRYQQQYERELKQRSLPPIIFE